ncbi:MAG TPA: FixH family protein [Acidimicrobiales bacterium]|nr:FixH family protein [Acidimicrobiales bacterium]
MKLRTVATAAALGAGAIALGVVGAAPAGAHSGGGTIVVEQVHPAGTSIHYIVLVTWDNDGHPAADATVTATPVATDGTAQTPFTLAPSGAGDGRYSGAVEFPEPGDWTVRFTSIEPTGTIDQAQTVTPSATPGASGGAFAAADDGTGASSGGGSDEAGDGDSIPVLLIVGAAIVALGGVVTALLAIRRNRPDLAVPAAATPTDTGTPTAADTPTAAGTPGDTGSPTAASSPGDTDTPVESATSATATAIAGDAIGGAPAAGPADGAAAGETATTAADPAGDAPSEPR